jgi:hypothetical protein
MVAGGQHHAPAALPPGKRTGTHCIGGWVGLRAALDGCRKSLPQWDLIPDCPALSNFAILTMLSRFTVDTCTFMFMETDTHGVVTYFPDCCEVTALPLAHTSTNRCR